MRATLAEVLRHFGPAYLREHTLSTPKREPGAPS